VTTSPALLDLADLPPGTLAVGWATVDLDRAAANLHDLLAEGADFAEAPSSAALGARCRRGQGSPAVGGLTVVLLEPATEGRLAASLARHGEGWVASWEPAAAWGRADTPGPTRPGPLGPERLLPEGPVAGPYRLLVSTATIGA
jgi:hypothetical protein